MSRTRATAKAQGAKFERVVADYMRDNLSEFIDRRPKAGSKDLGDLANVRTHDGRKVVVEVKDYGGRLELPQWLREAEAERENDEAFVGVVVAKRKGVGDPGQQFVAMTLDTLIKLLKKGEEL